MPRSGKSVKITVEHVFAASREELWNLLLNPAALARCIPGCQGLEESAPDAYTATLKVGVAAVKGTYTGQVRISEKQPPAHYRLLVEGGGALGFVRGEASLGFKEEGVRQKRPSIERKEQGGGKSATLC